MKRTSLFFLLATLSLAAASEGNNVCTAIQLSTGPKAYLVDKDGNISKGPIDFGSVVISSKTQGGRRFHSGYRIVVTPMNLKKGPEVYNSYGAVLLKTKPMCPKSETYAISINWFFEGGEIRPFHFTTELVGFHKTDRYGNDEELEGIYADFDPHVVGTLIDPPAK